MKRDGYLAWLYYLAVSLFLFHIEFCDCAPPLATDKFTSPCPFVADPELTIANNNFKGYALWSNPATWPNHVVPGVGSQLGSNAVIPCGKAVLLDVASIKLGLLQIKGLLRVLDDVKLPSISVKANYVLVEGQLYIGTPTRHFRQKMTFELTPNTAGGRAELAFTSFAPADPNNPRKLGHKAFAVVGGSVQLHGVPGGASTPSWVKLMKTAKVGDTTISVNSGLAVNWPAGAQLAVASTDYDWKQAEKFTIVKSAATTSGAILTLDKPFQYMHYGDPLGLPDGFGGFVDECAEVALLTRNIVIRGTQEAAPYDLEGGHFIVFQTPAVQYVEGVEFENMGQQGKLGRYPLHFHILRSVSKNLCRKNSVHNSNQRCIVLHATDNMVVEGNVAYNTFGHCFMTEEGGEMGNYFKNNLGFATKKAKIMISKDETDNLPSTYWFSNAQNNAVGNVAGGSDDSGFWLELRFAVRGASLQIPELKSLVPLRQTLRTFSRNVAHSNVFSGIRTYPHGWRPRTEKAARLKAGVMDNLLVYKNIRMGIFVHVSEQLTILNSTFADNYQALYLSRVIGNSVTNCRFIGLTKNYGNPSGCANRFGPYYNCRPLTGCKLPIASNSLGRSTGGYLSGDPFFGILIEMYSVVETFPLPNTIQDCRFSNYPSSCVNDSAIVTFGDGVYWCSGHSVKNLKFSQVTNRIWLPPRIFQIKPFGRSTDAGEQAQFFSMWEKDGSVSGVGPGYLIAKNNPAVLPPNYAQTCKLLAAMNAYACPKACYRTVGISYAADPGWSSYASPGSIKHGDFSYLEVTRSDGKVIILDGNVNDDYSIGNSADRLFGMSLLAGMTYQVVIEPSYYAPDFYPAKVFVRYLDQGGCGQSLTIQIKPKANKQFTVLETHTSSHKPCTGSAAPASNQATLSYKCIQGLAWAELALSAQFVDIMTLTSGSGSTVCPTSISCSLVWSGSRDWLYDATGKELHPSFYNPAITLPGWKTGIAPLGYDSYNNALITTVLPNPSSTLVTYYFRKSFRVTQTSCFTSLVINVLVKDGIVLYLNSKEVYRKNMPAGKVTNGTLANPVVREPISTRYQFSLPISATTNLVEGTNYFAAETHVNSGAAYQIAFDLRVTGIRKASCSAAAVYTEICDGLDNNNDGLVDRNATGSPLTQPCTSACGSGVSTCVSGTFQGCSAKPPSPEICNGIDDNCDGLVDNGSPQLNCGSGKVCYQGKCLAAMDGTQAVQVWPTNTTGWSYYDKGGNLDAVTPGWRSGAGSDSWKVGKAPLGFDVYKQPWNVFGTVINRFIADGVSMTAYFVKSFTLTQQELDNTFAVDFKVRRIEGAIVYLNGVEIHRSSMPAGKATYDSPALIPTRGRETSPGSNCCNLQWDYNPCDSCTYKTAAALKVGVNKIAVELHTYHDTSRYALFDMDLYRRAFTSCATLQGSPTQCVREVKVTMLPSAASWSYIDATLPVPAADWMKPSFNANTWKKGNSPLGFGKNAPFSQNTNVSFGESNLTPLRTYYFRTTVTLVDASCIGKFTSRLLCRDGAVIYINGVEAYRYNMPAGSVNSNTFSSAFGKLGYLDTSLSGGWLRQGINTIAVEVHRFSSNRLSILFDLKLISQREGVKCLPLPAPTAFW